jgi:signal transduction histidine kinase
MQVSTRFLNLLHFQLAQFVDSDELRSVVVYVTQPRAEETPALVPIGQWPSDGRALPTVEVSSPLRQPAAQRRWLPLRHQEVLLGAMQVESDTVPWPEALSQRLQAVALCLTEALCLDLEQQRLAQNLRLQDEQLDVLVHQLRNPLAALRTFGQLLLRRLEQDNQNRPLVEGLLAEERQLNRYVDAIGQLGSQESLPSQEAGAQPLLLPPMLSGPAGQPLAALLEPLLQRAAATAALQQRSWHPPIALPDWRGDSGAVAEILANLLENALRYSPEGAALGLDSQPTEEGGWRLTLWDGGPPINPRERAAIFEKGVRGSSSSNLPGTGMGLALARDLAHALGGELRLVEPPARVSGDQPPWGNAFELTLPPAIPGP